MPSSRAWHSNHLVDSLVLHAGYLRTNGVALGWTWRINSLADAITSYLRVCRITLLRGLGTFFSAAEEVRAFAVGSGVH